MKCSSGRLHKSHYSPMYTRLTLELYETASVVAIYTVDINKSVHINMLSKIIFYINVNIFKFLFTEISSLFQREIIL